MSINIFIQDLYLDFTYDNNVNLERRFLVELEINKENQEVLTFMSEMNSAFIKYEKLHNVIMLDNKDIVKEFNKFEEEGKNKYFKELLILSKENIYSHLKQVVIANIESMDELTWLEYCQKRYAQKNVEFDEEKKKIELIKFNKSNEKIKEIWNQFPQTMKEFVHAGEIEKAEKIPEKFANFWTEAHFHHLNEKLKKQNIHEKKPKI